MRPDLENRFTAHTPGPGSIIDMFDVRQHALKFAQFLDDAVPDGREKALALTNLEQVVFWANSGIARA